MTNNLLYIKEIDQRISAPAGELICGSEEAAGEFNKAMMHRYRLRCRDDMVMIFAFFYIDKEISVLL